MIKLKINHKILLLYVMVGCCLALSIGALLSSKLKKDRFATVYEGFQYRLSHVDFALATFFEGVEAGLLNLTLNDSVRTKNDEEFTNFTQADPDTFQYRISEPEQKIIDLFNNFRETHGYVNSVYMGRENGSFVRSHKRAKPTRYDPRDRPWYTLAKSNPGVVKRTQPYTSVTTPDINVGVVTALVDESGHVYGVVGMDVTLTDLTAYIEEARAGRNGYMILLDENGMMLATPNKLDITKNIYDVYKGNLSPVFGERIGVTTVSSSRGEEYLFFQTSLRSGWRLGIVIPTEEVDGEIRSFVNTIVLAVLASLALLSALTLFGVRKFVIRPLRKLSEGADLIARTGELNHPIQIHTSDEIGGLATSFNKMIDTIGRTEASLKQSEAELKKHRDHLEELVEERTAELRRTQEQLAEIEERSRLLLESAGEGIVGVDGNGKITFANPSAARMLGYSTEELVGQGLHDLVHHTRADDSPYPKEDCPMYKSYALGTVSQVEDEVLWRKDGSSFPAGYSSTPVTKEGTVVGAVVTFRDITERKKMDAELKDYVADLERFNRLVIGREERMIQLKEEINGLTEKLGGEKKYKIVQ